uniref:Uncharacterized protein n=1 Tax=Sander lucioperca TaxID=283035 RepID=A0A8D0AH23_SANLU
MHNLYLREWPVAVHFYLHTQSDELHVVQLLGGLPAEPALLGFAPLAVDGAIAHHLCHCPYHLPLLKSWLMSGQELPESLHVGCC